ncbi:hypothetical protein [Aerosakkonema funiforme]|uniref:Uncharacterized protein n=1 Tax=Aerosakkonema funiforme FACHB-1375 TaxID=2949571 RepID=A0A926VAW9_9CYAN|nr:hypothetical protein [Aerosakkonema funiforme]MBD2180003.1 hypothetical protein [Aerosakkonema funiforme FACHB-1375]
MSDKDSLYYPLNISLFAFTLQSGTDLDSPTAINEPPQSFKDKYEKLLKNNYDRIFDFDNNPFPAFRQQFPDSHNYELLNANKSGRQFFSFSSREKNPNPLNPKPLYRLLLYPQKLGDSYALLINIFRPQDAGFDTVNLNEIAKFNPNQCLSLSDDPNFIGQTFLITAYLNIAEPDKPEALRPHAEKLLKPLLGDTCPEFYQAEKFLDSYLLEFSRAKTSQTRVLVLFYFSDFTSEQLQKIYFDLPELFLYYHKIAHVYQMSRRYAKELDKLIQSEIASKSQLPDSLDLEVLKTNLKDLLKTTPKYTSEFRKLENAGNTININTVNYQRTLKRLQAQVNDRFELFSRFVEREIQTFQLQIQADLNYSKPGSQLLDQAIASIRGLVEIEQAENAEKLQNTIQAVGTGIGVGVGVAGIFATSYPLIEKPWRLPSLQHPFLPPHPFISAIVLSFVVGGGLGLFAWYITKHHLDRKLRQKK